MNIQLQSGKQLQVDGGFYIEKVHLYIEKAQEAIKGQE